MTYTESDNCYVSIIMEFLISCIPFVNMQTLITLGCFVENLMYVYQVKHAQELMTVYYNTFPNTLND